MTIKSKQSLAHVLLPLPDVCLCRSWWSNHLHVLASRYFWLPGGRDGPTLPQSVWHQRWGRQLALWCCTVRQTLLLTCGGQLSWSHMLTCGGQLSWSHMLTCCGQLSWSHVILKVIHIENGWVLLARPTLLAGFWLRAPDKINLITLATYLCLFLCYHRGPCNSTDPPTWRGQS